MGADQEQGKINWLPLSLYGISFLRVILENVGYRTEEGIVLVADDEHQACQYVSEYCAATNGNGVRIMKWNAQSKKPANFCCGLMILRKQSKEAELCGYLSEEGFLPVVVSGGILPDFLRTDYSIFRLNDEDIRNIRSKGFKKRIAGLKNHVLTRTEEICRMLERLDSSRAVAEYEGKKEKKNLFSILVAVGKVYSDYLRQSCSEQQVDDFFQVYLQETKRRLCQMEEFASGVELPEMISQLVWEYFENHQEVEVGDVREVGGKISKAVSEGRAILFDESFYYFSPPLFRKICAPLLETVSEPELKRKLRDADIVYCNSADYTVKKQFVNCYGVKERPRMMWIRKEFLISADNIYLEDIYK